MSKPTHPMAGKTPAEQLAFALGIKCGYEVTHALEIEREKGNAQPVYCIDRDDLCDAALKNAMSMGVVAGGELATQDAAEEKRRASNKKRREDRDAN